MCTAPLLAYLVSGITFRVCRLQRNTTTAVQAKPRDIKVALRPLTDRVAELVLGGERIAQLGGDRTAVTEPQVLDRHVRGACPHDCPDTCAWTVTVRDGRAIELRADREHPYTAGGLCVKVNRFLEDRVYHTDRILHPLRRTGTKGSRRFERIGWDEALDETAERLRKIIADDGPEAILPYSFMGTQGLVQGSAFSSRFFS